MMTIFAVDPDLSSGITAVDDLCALVIQTWPDMAHRLSRRLDEIRAEAALLALWLLQHSGWRTVS